MTNRTITIEIVGDGGSGDYTVREGDRYCDHLCWDEMLGQVVELTHPKIGVERYPMLTAEEHAERERQHQERMAAISRSET